MVLSRSTQMIVEKSARSPERAALACYEMRENKYTNSKGNLIAAVAVLFVVAGS